MIFVQKRLRWPGKAISLVVLTTAVHVVARAVSLPPADSSPAGHPERAPAAPVSSSASPPSRSAFEPPPSLAIETPLGFPRGIAFEPDGHLVFADSKRQRIFHLDDEGMLLPLAGTGVRGYDHGDGSALTAAFSDPTSVVIGSDGAIFVSDTANHRVRRIDSNGAIRTVAGTGEPGFSGDGGPAVAARLHEPRGLSIDPDGVLYVADAGNRRVRRIRPNGMIDSAVGDEKDRKSGASGTASLKYPVGVQVDGEGIAIADREARMIFRATPDGVLRVLAGGGRIEPTDGTPALDAALGAPIAVRANRAGTVAFLDARSGALFEITKNGRLAAIVSPSTAGNPLLTNPADLAPHPQGGWVVSDWGAHRIVHVTGSGSPITLAGNGEDVIMGGTDRRRPMPAPPPARGMAFLPDGSLILADQDGGRLLRLTPSTSIIEIPIRNGVTNGNGRTANGSPGVLYGPSGLLALSDGGLLVAELRSHRIRRVQPEGRVVHYAGLGSPGFSGDGGPAARARFWSPSGLAIDSNGRVLIADSFNHRIRVVGPDGTVTTLAGGRAATTLLADSTTSPAPPRDAAPTAPVSVSADSRAGSPPASAAVEPAPPLKQPMAVVVDASGAMVVADTGNSLVRRIRADGTMETIAGGGADPPVKGRSALAGRLWEPVALAYGPDGVLAIADSTGHRVWGVAPDNRIRYLIVTDRDTGNGSNDVIEADDRPNDGTETGAPDPLEAAVDPAGPSGSGDPPDSASVAEGATGSADGDLTGETPDRESPGGKSSGGTDRFDPDDRSDSFHASRPMGLAFNARGDLFIALGDRVLRRDLEGRVVTVGDAATPGWTEIFGEKETGTPLSNRLNNVVGRINGAKRSVSLAWRAPPRMVAIGGEEAILEWETQPASWSVVEFGIEDRFERRIVRPRLSGSDAVRIEGLRPGRRYAVRVRSSLYPGDSRTDLISRAILFTTRGEGEPLAPIERLAPPEPVDPVPPVPPASVESRLREALGLDGGLVPEGEAMERTRRAIGL